MHRAVCQTFLHRSENEMKRYEFQLPHKVVTYELDNPDNVKKYTKSDIIHILRTYFSGKSTLSKIKKEDLIRYHLDSKIRRGEAKDFQVKQRTSPTPLPQTLRQQQHRDQQVPIDDQIEWILQLGHFWKTKHVDAFMKLYYRLSDNPMLNRDLLNSANIMASSLLAQQQFNGIQTS